MYIKSSIINILLTPILIFNFSIAKFEINDSFTVFIKFFDFN